jgi:hypothetical protein
MEQVELDRMRGQPVLQEQAKVSKGILRAKTNGLQVDNEITVKRNREHQSRWDFRKRNR